MRYVTAITLWGRSAPGAFLLGLRVQYMWGGPKIRDTFLGVPVTSPCLGKLTYGVVVNGL